MKVTAIVQIENMALDETETPVKLEIPFTVVGIPPELGHSHTVTIEPPYTRARTKAALKSYCKTLKARVNRSEAVKDAFKAELPAPPEGGTLRFAKIVLEI